MINYWIIAPYNSEDPENFENAWNYDVNNNTIAIGWKELGDISKDAWDQIYEKVHDRYKEKGDSWLKKQAKKITNAVWHFYHNIKSGDIIIARRGTKKIIGKGEVKGAPYYSTEEGKKRTPLTDDFYSNFLKVKWTPINIDLGAEFFSRITIYKTDQEKYNKFMNPQIDMIQDETVVSKDQQQFALEMYLEEFIVDNFSIIPAFEDLELWYDDDGILGKQYSLIDDDDQEIGRLDILAKNKKTNTYIVIELKKGKSSDVVVGQILKYMGWVQEHLCEIGESVRGLIICKEKDKKLEYALKPLLNVELKLYNIHFDLSNPP